MNLENFYKESYRRQVHTVSKALKFNKHLAEDVVQEAYVKAYQYFDSYSPEKGTLNAWFNKILFNTLRSYQKDFGYHLSLNEETALDEEGLEFLILLHQEISQVRNPKHRNILELFYCVGYSSKQVCASLNITRTNVTSVCSRFRKQVREKYGLDL